ncbi:MAG TPA: FtsQ-type POTRA domain-containing protein [Terracidiphilus sp.]|nr:FtsQ-type POTRA domain-containing protein [Terracidiphilus sp.]
MNQGNTTSRPLIWEDEAPAESRFRRMQQGVPRTGRALPGMPLEMQDPEGDDPPRSDWGRFGAARGNWWRPASTVGRVFLVLSAVIVLSGVTTTGVLFKHYLERDARFRIAGASHIQATGLTEVSRAQMLPVFGEDIGRNVFFVPLNERRKELEAIPWVEHATVMRLLPDQIRVNLVERQPVAFTRHGQQIGLVDANGVLLDMPASNMAVHHYSFPVVTGIDPGDKAASRQARMAMYGRLMAELDSNNQHFSDQISEIDLTDPEDARVLMPAQGADILAHFGEDHFLERYQRYQAHIAEWRQQYPKLAAVDLRYERQVVLEMASGVSATQPAVDADGAKPSANAPTAPAKAAPNAVSGKPSVKSVQGKGAPDKSAKTKSGTKSSSSSPTKAKTTAAKNKAAQDKKRAQAKPVAQNANKQKPSPATHPSAAQGQ